MTPGAPRKQQFILKKYFRLVVFGLANMDELVEAVMAQLFVPIEASGRHVHLTKEQAITLFGHGLTPKRPLSQPGQYLSEERVTLIGPKGELDRVAVLGPERNEAQVEISLTDGKALGILPPIRLSGKVAGTPGITLRGPRGEITLHQGVMAAQRHIHLNPQQAQCFGVCDKQVVRLQTFTQRPVIFEDVVVRVNPEYEGAVHLDYDEANACALKPEDFGRILP
jgi:propanediol utilization protein